MPLQQPDRATAEQEPERRGVMPGLTVTGLSGGSEPGPSVWGHEAQTDLSAPLPAQSVEAAHNDLPSAPAGPARTPLPSTRAGRAWARVLPALVVLALLLVFVFQNLGDVKVSFFTASGRVPEALALVASAAAGALLVLAIGSVRILQLRRAVKKHDRLAARS